MVSLALAVRWRKLKETDGVGRFEVEGEIPVTRDPADARIFMFPTAFPAEHSPVPGDMVLVGETAQVALECLVKAIEPDAGDRARVTLIDFAPERFTDDEVLPPHDPKVSIPLGALPATPILVSAIARSRCR